MKHTQPAHITPRPRTAVVIDRAALGHAAGGCGSPVSSDRRRQDAFPVAPGEASAIVVL